MPVLHNVIQRALYETSHRLQVVLDQTNYLSPTNSCELHVLYVSTSNRHIRATLFTLADKSASSLAALIHLNADPPPQCSGTSTNS